MPIPGVPAAEIDCTIGRTLVRDKVHSVIVQYARKYILLNLEEYVPVQKKVFQVPQRRVLSN